MSKIRCAVIGVGYLGRFHAQKYQLIPDAELVGVCDLNKDAVLAVAQELDVPVYYHYEDLLNQVDAVSIAATTCKHFEIAKAFLEHGVHVLVEKPITETVAQAKELITLARKHNLKLQVGHLERFNSARLALDEYLDSPLFIESERLAPFKPRGADVNVILDVMIHDIDLIQNMVKSPIVSILAQGTPILTKAIDIANARITFANHCVANLTASRVSFKSERKTRIFQKNSYLSIDYQSKKLAVFKKGTGEMFPGVPDIIRAEKEYEQGDALYEEIKSFLQCIQNDSTPLVTGEDGLHALDVAETITSLIQNNLIEHHEKI
ncbi:oxidoreductase [Legionella wadsworthii]|uniref:Oxidoreductase n=1 Tax=Legionella wadsworthii TaxID=28088 RepID=A0A378LZI5_9GAMM|nr:Gfo/Idh/MocA family oxidoreductase [Legionella wadsworthii]STY29471.1 oxidoreductase [Legionella wadsworthii]